MQQVPLRAVNVKSQ